jgi:hypothetical protein
MAILQETPPTPEPTALSSLDQATGMSRSPTPERRRDDALYDAPSPTASPADPALRSLPAKSLLPSRAPLPPGHFPFPRSASSPPFFPSAAQLARFPFPRPHLASFPFFPSAVRRDVHAWLSAEEERITRQGCGGGGSKPNPRSRRRWGGGGGGGFPVRPRWTLNTAVPVSRCSRRRATTTSLCSRTRWRVNSGSDHPPNDGNFIHGRRWLPRQLIDVHRIPLPTSTIL